MEALSPVGILKNEILLDLRKERIQLELRMNDYLNLKKQPIQFRSVSLKEIGNIIEEISNRLKEIETSLEEIKNIF